MRFKKYIKPELSSERIVFRFLLFPKCINGEYRWLEFALIKRKWLDGGWTDLEWVKCVEKF